MSARKTILTSVVGSTLHGTSVDDGLEDLDLMSVVLESPADVMGFDRWEGEQLRTKPEGVRSEAGDVDHSIYGLRKWLGMACNGNPTALLPLFAPNDMLRECTVEGAMLRAMAPSIVSKKAYPAFRGYMLQQRVRMANIEGRHTVTRPELVARYGFDTKYAGHIVRLGMQGVELMKTGRLTLPMMPHDRARVVAVRTGKYTRESVLEMMETFEDDIMLAYAASELPEQADWPACERFMLSVYEQHWHG